MHEQGKLRNTMSKHILHSMKNAIKFAKNVFPGKPMLQNGILGFNVPSDTV